MDSFNGPIAPCPTIKPSLEPVVPDVSLLITVPTANTYKCWKNNKTDTSIVKKQVRFNSPILVQNSTDQLNMKTNSLGQKIDNMKSPDTATLHSESRTPPMNKVFKNRQFQEIYMANIPNRQLDLSLIDVVKSETKSQNSCHVKEDSTARQTSPLGTNELPRKQVPTSYKEFLEMQQCDKKIPSHEDNVTDIFNYNSPKNRLAINQCFRNVLSNETSVQQWQPIDNQIMDHQQILPNILENSASNKDFPASSVNVSDQITNLLHVQNMHGKSTVSNQQREVVSDNYNQSGLNPAPEVYTEEKHDSAIQTSIVCRKQNEEKFTSNDEPSVKDLLKIIQQQNEQLLILQKQVASLLDRKDRPKEIEAPVQNTNQGREEFMTNGAEERFLHSAGSTPRKGPLPKFSIDMMTSFEVSFRPPQNVFQRKQKDFLPHKSKIQEIKEIESSELDYGKEFGKGITDSSLQLQESINVRETCPSPEPSIKIDMQDYESSDEEDDETSGISATFYKNLMDQVNKIIQNAQKQPSSDNRSSLAGHMRDKALSRVKDATIKHLRKIGMNFPTIDEVSNSDCSNPSGDSTSQQISFAVKQLLMKYLPDEHLAKLTPRDTRTSPRKYTQDKIVLNSRAPEFSFASVQFMKKYNLIATEANDVPRETNIPARALPRRMCKRPNNNNQKILDITALKQQPKLL